MFVLIFQKGIMNLLISYGTRPEYIKIVPLLEQLKETSISYKVLYTGQQQDIVSSDIADIKICWGNGDPNDNRLDSIIKHILNAEFIYDNIDYVLVQGDTTSAFAVALAAFHRKIPIIHLEAGLRTYEHDPYPEEFNRTAISKMASIHLAPTKLNRQNLIKEGIPKNKIYVTGNTVLDNLINIKTEYTSNVVITLHRRENHDIIPEYFKIINNLAINNKDLTFTIPIHPNPNVYQHKHILTAENINVGEPMEYDSFIEELARC